MKTASERVTDFLEARGLDIELATMMGWGAANYLGTTVLQIPYYRDGKIVTTQFRALDKKEFRFAKDSEIELWNLDCLRDDSLSKQPLVLAEGACDGLALVQCGFARTVAVPGWSNKNFDPDNYGPFTRNEELITRAKRIIVARHADDTGAAMLRAVSNFFSECNVSYVTWPKGCKDANDCLLMHGPEAVVRAVSSASEVDPPGGLITGFSDLPPKPDRSVWRIDQPFLDKIVAFRSREISVLTGIPGAGKTTFATWLAHQLVRVHDIRIGLCLFETDPAEVLLHLTRLHGKQPTYMTEDEEAALAAKLDRNYRLAHRVDEGDEAHGMTWLKNMIHKLAARDGCRVIFVDPWNELEHDPQGSPMTTYINFALMRLRQWAERYDAHICIIAHPRKMIEGSRPSGYDISDSAAWMNKVGMGWTLHPEEKDGRECTSLFCWKVRSRQGTLCRPGARTMRFDEDTMNYREFRR